jgi:hypothetical protein
MDFALIEEHPWKTALIIGAGAVLLYMYFRRGSSASADTTYQGGGYAPAATDPNAAAYNLQGQQIQASLAGLQIQTQGAIAIKQLDVGATTTGIAAQRDITAMQTAAALQAQMQQTAAELQLGLGSQQSTVDLARISAGVQLASIDAIERAYGMLNGPTGPNNVTPGGVPINSPVYNVGGSPGSTATPPVYVTLPSPVVSVGSGGAIMPPANGTPVMTSSGLWSNVGVPTRDQYGLDPSGGGMHCSPLDPACVSRQQVAGDAFVQAVANAQTRNNLQQGIANYQISVDAGVITPSQLAAMRALQAQLAA